MYDKRKLIMEEHWKSEDSCKKKALTYTNHYTPFPLTRKRVEWTIKPYHTSENWKTLSFLVGEQSTLPTGPGVSTKLTSNEKNQR
jgi:hypothetical protein